MSLSGGSIARDKDPRRTANDRMDILDGGRSRGRPATRDSAAGTDKRTVVLMQNDVVFHTFSSALRA
jgi:hypothetical protein